MPVLGALGFQRGPGSLAVPPETGARQPAASLARLAEALEYEYRVSPQLAGPKTERMVGAFLGRAPADAEALTRRSSSAEG